MGLGKGPAGGSCGVRDGDLYRSTVVILLVLRADTCFIATAVSVPLQSQPGQGCASMIRGEGGGSHKSTHLIPQMSSLLIFHFHLNRVFLIYLFLPTDEHGAHPDPFLLQNALHISVTVGSCFKWPF